MYKVLVADDEHIIREGLEKMIRWEELGYIFSGAAQNGIDALKMLVNDPVDIIITDIKMPGMDGLELISEIRKGYPDTEIIILSGYSDFEIAANAMKYGVKYYILKPCDEIEVMDALDKTKKEMIARRQKEELVKNLQNQLNTLLPKACEPCVDTSQKYAGSGSAHKIIANRMVKYINENLFIEELTLSWIALNVFYMNKDYLGKVFHEETGFKFNEYVVKMRMQKAKELITDHGEHKMCEIAEKIGYGNNHEYFSKLFKKITGMSPTKYKNING